MSDNLIMLTEANQLIEIIKKNTYVIVDFYADWCPPCKAIAPVISNLADETADVTFVKVDIDKISEVKEQYKITSIPTLIYFKEGKEFKKTYGFIAKRELENHIKNMKNYK